MQKTTNFNLNKPESTDPMRVSDFNENADKIDTALNSLSTAVAGRARVVAGNYKGSGIYGSGGKSTLSFDGKPLAVFLIGSGYNGALIRGSAVGYFVDNSSYKRNQTVTWGETSVSWYSSENASNQMNNQNTYYYVALLA